MEFSEGIHVLAAEEAGPVLEDLSADGARVFEVDTGGSTDQESIIRGFGDVVPLEPPVHGRSWEAFGDSLWEGLRLLGEERIVLAVRGEFWVTKPCGAVQDALDVLGHVVELLGDERAIMGAPVALCVILVAAG
ncbi:hypothetical protein [Streptomyces sp. NPDC059874]|uniref:hypothetical protein n=1 Tax=Streptomyces sp. NPDC059874 TaxID=3346983 RepID=UPI00364B633A